MSAADVLRGAARWCVLEGDCRDVLATLPEASVDAVVTDAPYELGFMGKAWDASGIAYSVDLWRLVLRTLKPGGHLLAFGGTRTYHRMAVAIEDAGFEIRDSLHWIYGTGFPKSLDVSKALDAAAGAEREKVRHAARPATSGTMAGAGDTRPWIERSREVGYHEVAGPIPATPQAAAWQGWGTALKPSHEPIVLARKPLAGTVAATVAAHGTGALHVAACRVEIPEGDGWSVPNPDTRIVRPACGAAPNDAPPTYRGETRSEPNDGGRWPTNALFSHAPECDDACADGCPVAALDAQAGPRASGGPGVVRATAGRRRGNTYGEFNPPEGQPLSVIGDSGPASRFFPTFRYVAKPARGEREAGLRRFEAKTTDDGRAKSIDNPYLRGETRRANVHPTVKPVDLMRWLCRLVTPPGGVVLDPLTGSGTTGVAALAEGFRFVGVEREAEYVAIARARIAAAPGHQLPLLAEGDR